MKTITVKDENNDPIELNLTKVGGYEYYDGTAVFKYETDHDDYDLITVTKSKNK